MQAPVPRAIAGNGELPLDFFGFTLHARFPRSDRARSETGMRTPTRGDGIATTAPSFLEKVASGCPCASSLHRLQQIRRTAVVIDL
jgi:hypothetical protein